MAKETSKVGLKPKHAKEDAEVETQQATSPEKTHKPDSKDKKKRKKSSSETDGDVTSKKKRRHSTDDKQDKEDDKPKKKEEESLLWPRHEDKGRRQ